MIGWLKCKTEPGMFPTERAIKIETAHEGCVSLFAPDYRVSLNGDCLQVDVLAQVDDVAIVRLPGYPFEVSSRVVRVPRSALESFKASQG